jgi:hypothetical protein
MQDASVLSHTMRITRQTGQLGAAREQGCTAQTNIHVLFENQEILVAKTFDQENSPQNLS